MQAPNVVLSPVGGCAHRRAEARFGAPDCNCDAGEKYSGNDNGSRLTAPLLGIPEIPFWRDNAVFVEKILKLFRTGFLEALIEPGCLFGVHPSLAEHILDCSNGLQRRIECFWVGGVG